MRRLLTLLFLLLCTVSASAAVTGTAVADDGAPLAGARVRAYAREPLSATFARLLSNAPDPVPVAASESAADGRFSVDAKGNATVDVIVDVAGREPAAFYAADGDDAGAVVLRTSDKARRARVVADGKPLPNALVYAGHALLLRTDAQGTVAFVSTGETAYVIHPDYGVNVVIDRNNEIQVRRGAAVRGRVVGRDGTTPVAGAVISAGGWPLARSGDDGAFTIAHAPARLRALVAVSGADAGAAAVDPAKPVTIRIGTAASLSGSVSAAKGQAPIAGATVNVTSDAESFSAVTDAKGRYAIAALPAATYSAQVYHPAYVSARLSDLRVTPAATHSFPLLARARISGTVLTDDRKPAAGAFVAPGFAPAVSTVMTTPSGEFTLRLPSSGPAVLLASKSGYATAFSPSMTVEAGETKRGVTLTLQRGFPLQVKVVDRDRQPIPNANVDVNAAGDRDIFRSFLIPCSVVDAVKCRTTGADGTVERRIAEGKYDVRVTGDFVPKVLPEQALTARSSPLIVTVERGADVTGRVLFNDGTPVPDARVSVMGGNGPSAVSDANGAFTLKQLPRTPETLVATTMDESMLRSAPVKVTPPARNVALTIATPARVEGRVIDRATTQPVTSFNVMAARREGGFPGRGVDVNSDDGAFVLKRVPPGSIEVRVTAPGYVAGTVSDLTVEEGKALTGVEVKLDRGGRVTGHVTAGGSPAAGVSVRTGVRAARRPSAPAITDANGDYTLDGVPPGEETLEFNKQGFVPKRKSADIVAGRDVRLDVELDRGREIRGRVVERGGGPMSGVRVSAGRPSMPYGASATSDSDGQFTIAGLEDGRYKITAQKNGYVAATAEDVDAAAGQPVTLTLDRGGSIGGRVTGLAPEEMPQVRVSASGRNSGASSPVDANGNFTLTGVPDGSVTVTAHKMGMPSRQSAPKTVEVVNGSAPLVEIDFSAGITVRGRVTRNSIPFGGGNISFSPKGRMNRGSSSMIAPDGSYEVSGLEPGDYDVRVSAMGAGIDAVPYTVTGSATFDIDLKGATLRGVALDAATGAPLPEVRVYAMPAGRGVSTARNAVSDSEGRFVLDPLPDGTYNIRGDREHYAAVTQSVTVSGGGAPPIELRLAKGQDVAVRIVDADGGALLDGSVVLLDAQKKFVASGSGRGEDGAIHIWAAPGRYTVQVHVPNYISQNAEVYVPGPEVRVAVTRGATLVLTSRAGGQFRLMPPPLPGAGGVVGRVMSVPVGERMTFPGMSPGVWDVVKLDAAGKPAKHFSVVLTPGQTATLDAD